MLITRNRIAGAALAAAASAIGASPAAADWTMMSSCVGGWGMRSCVLNWRDNPRDPHLRSISDEISEEEARRSEARDRKWMSYCKPVLVEDRYGVARYRYAKPGCEFGRSED